MKHILTAAIVLALAIALGGELRAGSRQLTARTQTGPGPALVAGAGSYRGAGRRNFQAVKPSHFYYYVPRDYYQPYYPAVVVVSPYAPAYVPPPTVVVTSSFFCALHNEGWVSRIGLLDHLSGMHKISLNAAADLCPDGGASCVFPSY